VIADPRHKAIIGLIFLIIAFIVVLITTIQMWSYSTGLFMFNVLKLVATLATILYAVVIIQLVIGLRTQSKPDHEKRKNSD